MTYLTALCFWALASLGAITNQQSLAALQERYSDLTWKAMSRAKGDSAKALACREVAFEFREKAWRHVRKQRAPEDLDAAWRFALSIELDAGGAGVSQLAADYLSQRPEGGIRSYAGYLLAFRAISLADDSISVDRIIEDFDSTYTDDLLARGKLKAMAAEKALREGGVERARRLLRSAIALPKSEEELEEIERSGGGSWHSWWEDKLKSLTLYERDWTDFGSRDIRGESWAVGDYKGSVLLVDYWASW